MLLGIDTGGTFTDFVLSDGAEVIIHKVLSTPAAPEQAILRGIQEMGVELQGLRVIHGSTVATNAVLEGKGARTVYITNRGFKDVLSIGRQARKELYNLQPAYSPPPVEEALCLETGGRIDADGKVLEPLLEADLQILRQSVSGLQPQSVAINLLFSYVDDRFERMIAGAMPEDIFVSRSSKVLAEYREYERGISTWLNAYVGPLVQGYLQRLGAGLGPAQLAVMRSSGNTSNAHQAGYEAVHLLLSGPAGGLTGARYVAAATAQQRLITFDMGGTSTDVALIDGEIGLTSQGRIAGYPVGVPMVDMHTIGAGGGSIATADAGGALQVGPESAGASPGPACYGLGGEQATVTDANLVLGHLPATARLGGNLALDYKRACNVLALLAERLSLNAMEKAAEGVIRLANEHMVQALKIISVQRGIDPRGFLLVAFGGAGGMHVCTLADALGMRRAMVPIWAGVLSALGMLVAPVGRQFSRTLGCLLQGSSDDEINQALEQLADLGRQAMAEEGFAPDKLLLEPSLDLCYRGQSYTLNLPWQGMHGVEASFHGLHETRFGHRLDVPVELINVRMGVKSRALTLTLPRHKTTQAGTRCVSRVYGIDVPVPVWQRASLGIGQLLAGPAIIMDAVATIWVAPGWNAKIDSYGNILLANE
ncbi:MAG: hydantoinase/oxoprolinase family protein [Gammaproteobacteria bacterium]